MSIAKGWDPETYDEAFRRLVPCFDPFYGTAADLVARTMRGRGPLRMLDLGAGTGALAAHVAAKVSTASLTLLDGASDMLAKAEIRLADYRPVLVTADMKAPLPQGPFDVIMSSLAIHHLEHDQKRSLFARIYQALAPGGMFVNAEQILAPEPWLQALYEEAHIDSARALGSSDAEISASRERMKQDRCATLQEQCDWLRAAGFARVGVFFQWQRFAVYAAWKSE